MDGNIEKMQSLTGRIKGLGIDKTLTKKGMCAEAEATGKALATKVSITDIVDDLLSVASDKPLSANQGRLLKKQIDEIDPHYAENVIYDDTNVKDAIDKLSKAENIAYDEEKSVQGAIDEVSDNVADVQTQIDKIFDISGTHQIIGILSKSNRGQFCLVYKLPFYVNASLYNITLDFIVAESGSSTTALTKYMAWFEMGGNIIASTTQSGYEGCMARAQVTITKK